MLEALVARVLKAPGTVLALACFLLAGGLYAFKELNIEAYPNPVPPMIEVIAQPDGFSGEEVERYVTLPLEVGLSGIPHMVHMRSQSLFGLSDVKCYFDWNITYDQARQEVLNRLGAIALPANVQPSISPWNAVGEVFRYTLEGEGYSLAQLKAAEDFILERQWRRVPGVTDVTSFGGETKQYHVEVDPNRLRAHKLTVAQVNAAVANANQNVGGQRMSMGDESYDIRGVGLIKDEHDLEDIVVVSTGGTPVRIGDIAHVTIGPAPRLGVIGQNEKRDVVQGIVLMRYGAETEPTLRGVYQRLAYIRQNKLLPPGMEIKPYYARGELVHETTNTVLHNLVIGILLVTGVLVLFLGDWRAALIAAVNIPLALLIAFAGLVLTKTSANLISLGAVDFGIVVDSTVIMMENIFRHVGKAGTGSMKERILIAAREVAAPMTWSTLIICVAFLPLFTLTGVSGVIFAPMARTYAFAISGAILLAITLTPVLASKFIPAETEEREGPIMRFLHRVYDPLFDAALRRPRLAVFLRAIPILACVALFPLLGREFMPKLEEGNLWIRATLPLSINRERAAGYAARMSDILRGCPREGICTEKDRKHPEVLSVTWQVGRPDDGTDVTGFSNIELFAPLVPLDKLPHGQTKQELIAGFETELKAEFPGVFFGFSQMISDNVEEVLAGVKGENAVKVFGPDLRQDEKYAHEVAAAIASVKGISDLGVFDTMGQPNMKIVVDRKACARYGLNTGDVNAVVQAAIGGATVTQVFEGEKVFAVTVRWMPQYRQSVEAVREIPVGTPDGYAIPLGQLASVSLVEGPSTVWREDAIRYIPVKFSVRGRDLASAVADAQKVVAEKVKLPYGIHIDWSGEFNELKQATQRLLLIVPLTLLLIGFLVYRAVHNWLDTAIVLIDIPVACTGGVLALLVTGQHFSVSAAMGFISIFGIAVQDALLMVTYFQRLHFEQGVSVEQAAREASEKRFRPVLMTTLVATLGLLPAALAHGIGADTQRPLAIVVIGGSLQLAILTRLLQPPLRVLAYRWLEARRARSPAEGIAIEPRPAV